MIACASCAMSGDGTAAASFLLQKAEEEGVGQAVEVLPFCCSGCAGGSDASISLCPPLSASSPLRLWPKSFPQVARPAWMIGEVVVLSFVGSLAIGDVLASNLRRITSYGHVTWSHHMDVSMRFAAGVRA